MERKVILTEDGSHTVSIPSMGVSFHSIHGAVQESKYIFIEAGLNFFISHSSNKTIRVFEAGFGTGLNALLTYLEAEKRNLEIYYETVDLYPLNETEFRSLNYCTLLERSDLQSVFEKMHLCEWGKQIPVSPFFSLKKINSDLPAIKTIGKFDLIYFDAFDPKAQPELWSAEIFGKMFSILKKNGILVTYSSKGEVRRAMQSAGFSIEKIPGPKGKREIVRAVK